MNIYQNKTASPYSRSPAYSYRSSYKDLGNEDGIQEELVEVEGEEGSEEEALKSGRKEYMISVNNMCVKCGNEEDCRQANSSKLIMLSKPS